METTNIKHRNQHQDNTNPKISIAKRDEVQSTVFRVLVHTRCSHILIQNKQTVFQNWACQRFTSAIYNVKGINAPKSRVYYATAPMTVPQEWATAIAMCGLADVGIPQGLSHLAPHIRLGQLNLIAAHCCLCTHTAYIQSGAAIARLNTTQHCVQQCNVS